MTALDKYRCNSCLRQLKTTIGAPSRKWETVRIPRHYELLVRRRTPKYILKGFYQLISITKEEKEKLIKKFPTAFIAITGRSKKSHRKRYYACESSKIASYIKALRKRGGCQ